MEVHCVELEGAIYQPKEICQVDDFCIVPGTKVSSVLHLEDCKVFLFSEKKLQKQNFIFCYQFLFHNSAIYYYASLPAKPKIFIESGDIIDIAKKHTSIGGVNIDFEKIDTFYTGLSREVNFLEFYTEFVTRYRVGDTFKDIVDLFLYTVGSDCKFYNNIFQKISNLQTIFETLTGKPVTKPCGTCGTDRHTVTWKVFLSEKLKEKGFSEAEVKLIIKIKNLLNKVSRVKFVHNSKQLNTREKMLEEINTGDFHYNDQQTYTTDFNKVLNELASKDWASIDWESVFTLYKVIIKRMIFCEYFEKKGGT